MVKSILFISLSFLALFACNPTNEYKASYGSNFTLEMPIEQDSIMVPKDNYYAMKAKVGRVKTAIKLTDSMEVVAQLFTTLLVDSIIPYWYGTPWSFEGHTSKPNDGTIACGYFVSTTLNHVGVKINRYRLAQQWPMVEAKSLSVGATYKEIMVSNTDSSATVIERSIKPGIYFIGFGSGHVGYLYKNDKGSYIIHSNYLGDGGVTKESIYDSEVVTYFETFYISDLSNNWVFLNHWLHNKELKVYTE